MRPKALLRPLFPWLALAFTAVLPYCLPAQEKASDFYSRSSIKVFHLSNVGKVEEANEIVIALRNMINPQDKIYLVASSNDVVASAPPEELSRIGQLISELDHPKRTYRVTYTLNESDGGRRVGVQHFSMLVLLGQRVVLKQGDKVPVLTGSYSTEKAAEQTQFTYLDVGVNLDTTLDAFAAGLRLRSKVEQSSVAAEPSGSKLADDPIVRQSVLEGTSVIVPGKPMNLGAIDIVGSTRHVDVELVVEQMP